MIEIIYNNFFEMYHIIVSYCWGHVMYRSTINAPLFLYWYNSTHKAVIHTNKFSSVVHISPQNSVIVIYDNILCVNNLNCNVSLTVKLLLRSH